MFNSVDHAREALSTRLTEDVISVVLAQLIPAFHLVPQTDPPPATLTHIGGAPRMAADIAWPMATDPYGPDETSHFPEVIEALGAPPPLAFIGQVDLASLPDTAGVEGPLPDHGRLVFFYDFLDGPAGDRPGMGRVIWDTSAPGDAVERPIPAALIDADRLIQVDSANWREAFSRPDDWPGTSMYIGIRQGMTVAQGLMVAPWASLEAQTLHAALPGPEEGREDLSYAIDDALHEARRNGPDGAFQLLGAPRPEQDDPRFTAVYIQRYGEMYRDTDIPDPDRNAVEAEARNLRLLFQVDVTEWAQVATEGTVYFLIHRDDLAARHFERVITIYQQT